MKIVRVALPVPLHHLFDYLVSDDVPLVVGARVLVPFGTQKKVAIVVELPETTEIPKDKLKEIIAPLDSASLFSSATWEWLLWAANYYQGALGDVLFQALPVKLRHGESAVKNDRTFWRITDEGRNALRSGELTRSKKQAEALRCLSEKDLEKGEGNFSPSVWSALKSKHFVQEIHVQKEPKSWQSVLGDNSLVNIDNRLTLNKQQALAFSQLMFQREFNVWLLDGVTGSGKTEIYLQYIEEILKSGKQVLVLVPEIGLTPQTVQRFEARFNVEIDVLHSHLNDTQRLNVWARAKTGQSAVVIGTRSALFTQFANLGAIILDEEHDASFKQQDGWRYHARDLAIVLAQKLNIPMLMGSATPSLESLNNVKNGKYKHLTLSKRAGNTTALRQFVIDLKNQPVQQGLSQPLLARMKNHLEKGNQVLLFLNRRGFAPVLLCHECGWIAQCSHCEKPYTYHQHQRVLRCHHCGSQKTIPRQCGDCGSTHLVTTGLGTEQLEETLKAQFPTYSVARIDRDSTSRKGSLEGYLEDIQQGKSQILIGTQMLAKGHHFPNVTLVALVNVDSALFSLDFRAEERLAQLYVQVAGRSGRAEKQGEVVLQTHYPDHPLLTTLLAKGYQAFAEETLHLRHTMGLPPFSFQALFKAQARYSEQAEECLIRIADFFHTKQIEGLQILGPIPAPFSKKAGQFRWQLLLQHPSRRELQKALRDYQQANLEKNSQVRLILDVDPQDLS
ncbi:primosomal protein N' [Rodentibacter pneumotropicus]|uniref:primosomal protein N' n=1 Tax=Rodentibacter pneumotropicus TaxID=758 RepID=UPI00036EA594|nr:primosomal protein N' [Rodentibacter pneumotropicus]NBH75438.1 primosomal protein N' [Rodentibacter pneumotropicus]OOF65284.1 primosomal protein N' [Rodentibacter pneumotropicus]THA00653.1 primosomal protein N' [Rodentibacter pneumotropicus]THA07047.1 primosomal protein N' [Rodentibacter pneumotropicus]THA12788.1 primosomal protein N' [Rodentibacter pneumotropicus]